MWHPSLSPCPGANLALSRSAMTGERDVSIHQWDKLEAFLRVGDIESFVLGFVELYDYVTFPQLATALGGAANGDAQVWAPHDRNLVLWAGMSETFAAAVRNLLQTKRLRFESMPALAYELDDAVLQLPVAEQQVDGGFEEPHSLPAVLRPGEQSREHGPANARVIVRRVAEQK